MTKSTRLQEWELILGGKKSEEIVRLFVLKLVEMSCVYIVPDILRKCKSAEVTKA